ncbi:MAG: OadG family protein [Clostridia bacterium]|nr:OadG family protein [Clostridia bacterium]
MSIFESIIAAIFCMVVVFAVLAILYVLIKLFSFGIRKIEEITIKPTE